MNTESKTKIVVVIYQPSGETIVNQIESGRQIQDELGANAGTLISQVKFEKPPKRLQFFLEKWGKGKADSSPNKED